MNFFTRIADGFYYKLRFDPFRAFREKECSRKVQRPLGSCQVHILEQPKSFLARYRKIPLVEILQKIPKPDEIKFVNARFGRQFVRVELVHTLKNAP